MREQCSSYVSTSVPQERYRGCSARHGVGSHPDASGIFLKCVVVTNGCVRYRGSVTIEVTTSYESPFGALNRSKYSTSDEFSLYGTPFLRK